MRVSAENNFWCSVSEKGPLALATPGAAGNTKVYLLRQGSNSLGRCKNDQSLTNRW